MERLQIAATVYYSEVKDFITQVAAEIGAQKANIIKNDSNVLWQDKPRPRVYWYPADSADTEPIIREDSNTGDTTPGSSEKILEKELYPILMDFLKSEKNLHCKRINESSSSNSRGKGGNKWLHPDIVALEAVNEQWNSLVKQCATHDSVQRVRLWSFEVKIELTTSNVRESFFQAVSNSSWAHEGYLVASAIANGYVEKELQMLSALHGIGVILLKKDNPSESDILLPARARTEVDWQSVNRIVEENADFNKFIEKVYSYYQTELVDSDYWNKIKDS
ncbi:MAG: HrgA protein [bacterium]|nr:HrgA protein [bacterium]